LNTNLGKPWTQVCSALKDAANDFGKIFDGAMGPQIVFGEKGRATETRGGCIKMSGIVLPVPEDIKRITDVEKVIRFVSHQMKRGKRFGLTNDLEEGGAHEIIRRIYHRDFEHIDGFDRSNVQVINEGAYAEENQKILLWAATRYFKILLTDLKRYPEFFQDHQNCEPQTDRSR
jgi:hypothetical protein